MDGWELGYPGQRERTSAANSRRRSLIQTTSGKFDNGLNLLAIQPFEPFHNVIDVGTRFQIFKDDGDRHAGSAKYPGSAYLSRDAFVGGRRSSYQANSCNAGRTCNSRWPFLRGAVITEAGNHPKVSALVYIA